MDAQPTAKTAQCQQLTPIAPTDSRVHAVLDLMQLAARVSQRKDHAVISGLATARSG